MLYFTFPSKFKWGPIGIRREASVSVPPSLGRSVGEGREIWAVLLLFSV